MPRCLIAGIVCLFAATSAPAGDLNPPPGPVAPTMLTLDTVEPRTPITQDDIPLTITEEGSYYLTENVVPTSLPDDFLIRINASNVTLDLNGFTLIGSTEVTQATAGIEVGLFEKGVTIRNGTVRDCAFRGIDIAEGNAMRLEDLTVLDCPQWGIRVDDDSIVRGCVVTGCGDGFIADDANVFVDCTSSNNTVDGFVLGRDSNTLHRCVARENNSDGFASSLNTSFNGCSAHSNGSHGFSVGAGSTLVGCVSRENGLDGFQGSGVSYTGCKASQNGGDGFGPGLQASSFVNCTANENEVHGFSLLDGATLKNCIAEQNGSVGFSTGGGCTLEGCVATNNSGDGYALFLGDVVVACSAVSNSGDGFDLSSARVSGCYSRNNNENGFRIGTSAVVEDCVARQNGFGIFGYGFLVEGATNLVVRNRSNNNADGEFQNNGGLSNQIATVQSNVNVAGPWDNFDF